MVAVAVAVADWAPQRGQIVVDGAFMSDTAPVPHMFIRAFKLSGIGPCQFVFREMIQNATEIEGAIFSQTATTVLLFDMPCPSGWH